MSYSTKCAFWLLVCVGSMLLLSACTTKPQGTSGSNDSNRPESKSAWPADESAVAPKGDFSLTIYSTADSKNFMPQDALSAQSQSQQGSSGSGTFTYVPGFGVVREIRKMTLLPGVHRLEFTDVAAGIDPTSVSFQSLTAPKSTAVFEQNFEHDLASPEKLLGKHIGRELIIELKSNPGERSGGNVVRGKLLSTDYYNFSIQTNDPKNPVVFVRSDAIAAIKLAELQTGFVSKPTLNLKVSTETGGQHDMQVTYLTEGLTWRADYAVTLAADEKTADVSAWVTAVNTSGKSFPNAKLKLIAGNVRRFASERAGWQGGGMLFGGGGGGGNGRPELKESSFFDYHLYTLDRPTTLNHNSTKQIELFPPKVGVKVQKALVYYGAANTDAFPFYNEPQTDREMGNSSNRNVDIYVQIPNTRENGLGVPFPAGRVRIFKADPADGNLEFLGEDAIAHTPRDETVMTRIGAVFDVVGERSQTDFSRDDVRTASESFAITLRNHKAEPVNIIIRETLFRWSNWQITAKSDPYEKQDFRTIHFPVTVPANGEKKVTYTVKYTW